MVCTLCESSNLSKYWEDKTGSYHLCDNCELVFQNTDTYLDSREEKAIYDAHQNNPNDGNYRGFLGRLVEPLLSKISSKDKGLDFGCGPGPTISVMLKEKGIDVDNYDKYYTKDFIPQENNYNFVTSTEVFEHLYNPKIEIAKIWSYLKSDGLLGVMTVFRPDKLDDFKTWWYKNDPTHVCFYSKKTFEFLAKELNADLELISNQVVFLKKRG